MTDRPIIFSAPMVRALLDGRKTQTRRVLKPQPVWDHGALGVEDREGRWIFCANTERGFNEGLPRSRFRMPYAPGDRLYVREQCATWGSGPEEPQVEFPVVYAADDPEWEQIKAEAKVNKDEWKVRPSIHMPRWASRLTLTVTEVRVQRLQEISNDDAKAEGVLGECAFHVGNDATYRAPFRELWNSLHGPDAWDANPWVVAVSFTVDRRNIDAGAS